ncbi:hypothetical protein [Saccharothrix algeriensis]|uniref:Uncharacterized protein n=1 Tax=Saccharothrix algeriensis TaxID=173560 RepID=A0A8T8I6S9_9PSEU|nr:hypothetical protein [Saccharothrix algeriensis]MBM7815046.1 hypothetical protein [Saccharothrix algeriensis]QTR06545.1 hypothetical protein J7S33_30925 [Saccharothrix algeriensis]
MSGYSGSGEHGGAKFGAAKALLWVVLLVTAGVNAIGAFVGLAEALRLASGGVAVLCVVALAVLSARGRRSVRR